MVFLGLLNWAVLLASTRESGVDFRIMTDKPVYGPGSKLLVKFVIANTGDRPFVVPRNISQCSNIEGSFFLLILDRNNHDVAGQGCSADLGPTWETHVIEQVLDPKLWIVLGPGEIYGKVSTFELPKEKGIYRLKAELIPPGFTDKQREILSQKDVRALDRRYAAPIVTITVK